MIISHPYKLIFITTPKSGSLSGFVLMREYFGAVAEFNHNIVVPDKYKHYHSFTFVRNPYERFCSLWHSCVAIGQPVYINKIPKYAQKSILEYAKWYVALTRKHNYPVGNISGLYMAQHSWHINSGVKEVIKIEAAGKIMKQKYPDLNIKFPHIRKRDHPTWKDLKTEQLTELVNIWAGNDFALYNYKKEV